MASKFKAVSEKDRCVACGVCVKVCPKGAISIYKGCYSVIDEDICIGCGICEKKLPSRSNSQNSQISTMAKPTKKRWSDYLWIVSATYFTLGFFNIVFAWLGVICFLIPLLMAIFGGGKGYCNNYCGRGQLFLQIGNTLKWSRKKVAPRWLSSKWFRNGFLVFFMFFFIQMIILTVNVAKGVNSLHETIHLLWTFDVPWHWAYPTAVEPWVAQFAFGLYGIMLTSLIVGVILTVVYRPRTWCVFCPMGNMTQMICKLKNK